MNAKTLVIAVAAAMGAACAVAACSSTNDNNPVPTPKDAGRQDIDSGSPVDAGGADVDTSCKSDAATCNSCVAPSQDSLNACSTYTSGCVAFDRARVPKDGTGSVPKVP